MNEKWVNRMKLLWKIQHFQYDYVAHVKRWFVFLHFAFFLLSFMLIGVHFKLGLLTIPCMASWDYFMFFDRRKRAYRDSYVPVRQEMAGTLLTTLLFSVMMCLCLLT